MSASSITVTGSLRPDGTIVLDQKPQLPPGPVRVQIEPASAEQGSQPGQEFVALMERVWATRGERTTRTGEGIVAEIRAMREESDERLLALERIRSGQPGGEDA